MGEDFLTRDPAGSLGTIWSRLVLLALVPAQGPLGHQVTKLQVFLAQRGGTSLLGDMLLFAKAPPGVGTSILIQLWVLP